MKTSRPRPDHTAGHRYLACLLAFCIINLPVWALSGFNAVNGSASYNGSDTVTVNQLRSIIDWTDFNTGPGQLIEFLSNSGALTSNHAVLNRVTGGAMTNFQGLLEGGQGHIILVNPHGITIGSDAVINAGRFTASTMHLQMSDQDFLNGVNEPFRFVKGVNDPGAQIVLLVGSEMNAQRVDLMAQQISNAGTIMTGNGSDKIVAMAAGDNILLSETGSNVIVELSAPDPSAANNWTYNVTNKASGVISSPNGTVVMAAGDIYSQAINGIQDKAYSSETYTAKQQGALNTDTLEIGAANQAYIVSGSTTSAREIKIGANTVKIEETLQSTGSMIIDSDSQINALGSLYSNEPMVLTGETILVRGDIVSNSTATLKADIVYSRGDIISEDDLLLMAESVLWGDSDQTIHSDSSVKSTGTISKVSEGNVYISAAEDVQLDGDVSAVKGGVSVIAENGKIHSGDGTNALNVGISGYSDEITDSVGVELPNGEGKAAIVLKSHDTLNLGENASLKANGFYLSAQDDPDNGVDNRPDMMWLADDGVEIGGHERDEGIASDVAIYVGSEKGNVNIGTSDIETAQPGDVEFIGEKETEVASGPATVVFDALDTVTMPSLGDIEQQRQQHENNNLFRFRLEAATRITEWLFQAVQGMKLPHAGNPEAVEAVLGNDYVLRGAGLDNPQITDGRIWVLENPPSTPPSPTPPIAPVAPLPDLQLPELVGCPAEMQAAAAELGINSDELQLKIQNSMASNPNLQPCEACALLLLSANALQDEDGERFAAMTDIFNMLAPADAPFTPEAAASIRTAFADLSNEDPKYALAQDYIDSFVNYIAVLEQDLKTPIGDAVVYTLNKYGETIMSHPNQNMVTYLVEEAQKVRDQG